MWIAIEAPMITTFNMIHQQIIIQSTDHKSSYQTQISRFIDDNNIRITVPPSEDPEVLTQTITSIISTWNELLALLGRSLSVSKCFYYVIQWKWLKGTAKLSPLTTLEVNFDDPIYNRIMNVKEIDPKIGRRYLGVHVAPDGSMTNELSKQIEEANKYALCLEGNHFTMQEALIMNTIVWMPKL